jgi:hypothetical protein
MICSTPVSTQPSSKISEIPKLFKCSRHSPHKASSPHERSDMRETMASAETPDVASRIRALGEL